MNTSDEAGQDIFPQWKDDMAGKLPNKKRKIRKKIGRDCPLSSLCQMSAKVGQRRQNDNVIANTSGNRHDKSNKTKDDRVLPPVLAGPFAYRVRQQRIHANIQQEKTCAMHCFCASGFGSWGVLHALGRGICHG